MGTFLLDGTRRLFRPESHELIGQSGDIRRIRQIRRIGFGPDHHVANESGGGSLNDALLIAKSPRSLRRIHVAPSVRGRGGDAAAATSGSSSATAAADTAAGVEALLGRNRYDGVSGANGDDEFIQQSHISVVLWLEKGFRAEARVVVSIAKVLNDGGERFLQIMLLNEIHEEEPQRAPGRTEQVGVEEYQLIVEDIDGIDGAHAPFVRRSLPSFPRLHLLRFVRPQLGLVFDLGHASQPPHDLIAEGFISIFPNRIVGRELGTRAKSSDLSFDADEQDEEGKGSRRDEHEYGDRLEVLPVHRLIRPRRRVVARHLGEMGF